MQYIDRIANIESMICSTRHLLGAPPLFLFLKFTRLFIQLDYLSVTGLLLPVHLDFHQACGASSLL